MKKKQEQNVQAQKHHILNKFRKQIIKKRSRRYHAVRENSVSISHNKLTGLLQWFRVNGVEWDRSRIEIQYDEESGGFSVKAKTRLTPETSVCVIPKTSILSTKTSSISKVIEREELGGGLALTLCLMHEICLGPASRWFGYLQSLPENEDLPIFWKASDLNHLVGTELNPDSVRSELELLKDDFDTIIRPVLRKYPKYFNEALMSFDLFQKVTSLVSSRAFTIDDYHDLAMLPLGDLFNHKTGAENVHMVCTADVCDICGAEFGCVHALVNEDLERQIFGEQQSKGKKKQSDKLSQKVNTPIEMIISEDIEPGAEIFNVYEDLGNAKLLNKYGFCHFENPCDKVTIDGELLFTICIQSDPNLVKRWQYWNDNWISLFRDEEGEDESEDEEEEDPEIEFFLDLDGQCSPMLLSLLLTLEATNKQLKDMQTKKLTLREYIDQRPYSDHYSGLSKRILSQLANHRLSCYETTLDQDEKELESSTLTNRKRWALILRICEKQIIHSVLLRCK